MKGTVGMERVLRLVGKTSNEIFLLRYPQTLTTFCEYDLTYFVENATEVCNEALKSGELDLDRVTEIRNSLKNLHIYVEHNIRTIYDKIVLDCWIDYVCRRDNVGTGSLWNRFLGCKTPFEKLVFTRLCEFRYNKAINEWLNVVRVQDYAKNKVSFIFSKNLKSAEDAAARRNYFDLIFSVTAKELGCRLEDMAQTRVFSIGRVPTAPYMFPNISKSIVKNVLADFDYSEDYSDSNGYGDLSDQIAMDAFLYMKTGLEGEFDSYNIADSRMEKNLDKVFMPMGLKAAVDLEIDAIIEHGGWLARCRRCGRYFLRDAEHKEEFCSLTNPGGKTCLEIYEIENPKPKFPPDLEKKCGDITDEMYDRVDKTMSLSEYQKWKAYLEAMRRKVENAEIPAEELEAFINYSKTLDLSRSHPVEEVPKKPQETGERVVRPFVPERVYRKDIEQPKNPPEDPEEERAKREGFFTSPIVQRQKNERGPIAHIIRAGERRGGDAPPANTFLPFGEQPPAEMRNAYPKPENRREPALQKGLSGNSTAYPARGEINSAENPLNGAGSRASDAYRFPDFSDREIRGENIQKSFNSADRESFYDYNYRDDFLDERSGEIPAKTLNRAGSEPISEYDDREISERGAAVENAREPYNDTPSEQFKNYGFPDFSDAKSDSQKAANSFNGTASRSVAEGKYPDFGDKEDSVKDTPREFTHGAPKIIRKNAAAISAYGKMAGAVGGSAPEFERTTHPEPQSERAEKPRTVQLSADPDPFKDVGSIFDVLEQSESDMSGLTSTRIFDDAREETDNAVVKPAASEARLSPKAAPARDREDAFAEDEPAPEWEERAPVTAETAPRGIWTEERNLFPNEQIVSDTDEQSELAMLKERKRARSNKTQRLFDAIMREPDDNPNFRRR